ncbi:hypothetical protein, partial [Bifidobacterium mongoliense]|uniref:hypothetical protein n=1 Tax=Bifidobacterium mongoliense TaxID=518643 RepID=UPI0026476926
LCQIVNPEHLCGFCSLVHPPIIAYLPRLPMHHAMQSDQCLLRHETIIIKLLAGRIENIKIVVEDIGVGHTDSVSE